MYRKALLQNTFSWNFKQKGAIHVHVMTSFLYTTLQIMKTNVIMLHSVLEDLVKFYLIQYKLWESFDIYFMAITNDKAHTKAQQKMQTAVIISNEKPFNNRWEYQITNGSLIYVFQYCITLNWILLVNLNRSIHFVKKFDP